MSEESIVIEQEFKKLKRIINDLQKTVDHVVEVQKEQGEDISDNTKSNAFLQIEVETISKTLKHQGTDLADKMGSKIEDTIIETIPNAVHSVVEPHKKNLQTKKGIFSRILRGKVG